MKFKKVEIQGFRAYGPKEDATFDFTTNNEVADFIAIYAPNGFGKTSFYDAVEWTITNKIKRFENALKNYDLIKVEKRGNKKGNGQAPPINIISKKGYQSENKFVNIETTERDFSKKIESATRRGSVDYDSSGELENGSFRDVILSQEGINSFLGVDRPEDRYKNFIKNFDSENIDDLHGNLLALRKENDRRLRSIESELTKLSGRLNAKIDDNIIQKINTEIDNLTELNIDLEKIDSEFDRSDVPIFSSHITGIVNEINLGETSILETLKSNRFFLDQLIVELPNYENSVKRVKELRKLTDYISKTLEDFSKLQGKRNGLKKLEENKKRQQGEEENLLFLKTHLKKYLDLSKKAQELINESKRLNKYSDRLRNLQELILLNTNIFENRKQSFEAIKSALEKHINAQKIIEDLKPKLQKEKQSLPNVQQKIESLNEQLRNLSLLRKNLHTGIYELPKNIQSHQSKLSELEKDNRSILKKEEEAIKLKTKLKESESFQENLDYLLELGGKIIDHTKQSSCPLCKTNFESYQDLLKNINSNSTLESLISADISNLNILETGIEGDKIDLKKNTEEFISVLNKEIEDIQKNINEESLEKEKLDKTIKTFEKQIEDLQTTINDFVKNSREIDGEAIIKEIESEITESERRVSTYESIIKKYTHWISLIRDKESDLNLSILENENDQKELTSNSVYESFQSLIEDFDLSVLDKKNIEALIKKNKELTSELEKSINTQNREINILLESLKEYDIQDLKRELEKSEKEMAEIKVLIDNYEDSLTLQQIDDKRKKSSLKEKRRLIKLEVKKNEEVLRILAKVEKLLEPLGDFLNYQSLILEQNDLNRQKDLHDKIEEDLKGEIKKISENIQELITNFFYDDLINRIYAKIDPHPDYKEIKFDVDFTDYGVPKLNIFTENKESKGNRVPNLYFSTAQMNVLSLSIFLAKALHAIDESGNPINAIFVDDPVQSMDSINVLSVIDLLRNIVINHGKQIIISTHDENFYNLLKKKIPSEYYKSKFLELETFGRLKSINPHNSNFNPGNMSNGNSEMAT